MNTIIEVEYKNYTENISLTEANLYEVINILFSDKDIVGYKTLIEGDVVLEDAEIFETSLEYKRPSKAQTILNIESKINELESISWFSSDRKALTVKYRIEDLKKKRESKIKSLTSIEKLFI